VYAARGGATHVTSLDMSAHALESADRIFQLNSKVKQEKPKNSLNPFAMNATRLTISQYQNKC
jgi:hypothetical protein